MSISISDMKDCGYRKIFKFLISEDTFKNLNTISLVFAREKSSPYILSGKLSEVSTSEDFFGINRFRVLFNYNDDSVTTRKNFSKAYMSFLKKCSKAIGLDDEEAKLFISLGSLCPILAVKRYFNENILNEVPNLATDIINFDINDTVSRYMLALNCMLVWQMEVESNPTDYMKHLDVLVCSDNADFVKFLSSCSGTVDN